MIKNYDGGYENVQENLEKRKETLGIIKLETKIKKLKQRIKIHEVFIIFSIISIMICSITPILYCTGNI